jgi:myo-inositol-1(or 4)-monophosphatase
VSLEALHALADLAERAARAGGEVLLERFGAPATGVDAKSSRTDLVSDADRAAEERVLARIRAERPGNGIVAEEGGGAPGGAGGGVRWLVDPLDGTINFLWGIPHWSVSVAALDAGGGLCGVVHDPLRGETFRAVRGGGAALDGAPLRRGPDPPLAEALIGTGFNYRADERARQAGRMAAVLPRVRDVRRFGSAALDLAWVACGRLDGYFETGVQPWDWAAGALVAREAGAEVRELPAAGPSPAGVVAAGPALLGPLQALLDAAG